MLDLVVMAPGKRKVELQLPESATFGDVKAGVQQAIGVPPDKQRLLCAGKERKTASETLSSAGVTAKSKLMLMLAPGYEMPPPPAADAADSAAAAPAEEAAPKAVDLEGDLPCAGEPAGPAATVTVRQGANRYRVRVAQGLAAATFGELAEYLSGSMLPPGIPASELRLISKGKTPERGDVLCAGGGSDLTVMMMFREGVHVAAEGADWLKDHSAQLADAEVQIERIRKRVEANFCDAETSVKLAEVGGLVEMLKQSVEIVRVNETKLPEMKALQDRVLAADATLESLRKKLRL